MSKPAISLVLLLTSLSLVACSGRDDKSEPVTEGPARGEETRVVFNPSAGDLPIPNDLLFARETAADGTMSAGTDVGNPVISGIDALDGNSVISPIDIQFDASLDPSQNLDARSFVDAGGAVVPNPDQNVFLLPLTFPSGDPLNQAEVEGTAVEVPTFAEAAAYQRAAATGDVAALSALADPTARVEIISLDGGNNNVLRITPIKPLQPQTKYLVVVTNDVQDANGHAVQASNAYNFIRDPESPFDADDATVAQLRSLRDAITNWETLAAGYFNFMGSVYAAADVSASAPSADDIVMTLTFTTGGTDSVLTSVAAPEVFFAHNLATDYRKDAISKLVAGTYNLSGDNSGLDNTTDAAINSTLNFLLTSPTLPDGSPNPLYNQSLAEAVGGGASYSSLASDASAAYRVQTAAAEAAISVHNSGDAAQGDQPPYVDIATEAAGTVTALAGGNPAAVPMVFPVPSARTTTFFRVDAASALNPALEAPARVYQGEISLPSYQPVPESADGTVIKTGSWETTELGGGAVVPPSDMITYRYPFPEKQEDVTVPILAVTPDATTLSNFGISKPADGWPVVIYVHGITTDRSTALPTANALAFACVKPDLSGPSGLPCFATVAIDQPLHGVAPSGSLVPGLQSATDPDSTLTPNLPTGSPATPSPELTERHFDFTADAESNPIPMDYAANIGTSGSLFINLTNFTSARSNMQQMVVDLLNLNASLATMDVDGDGNANDINPNQVYFVGHSLGAISGTAFVSVNNSSAVQSSPFNALPQVQAAAMLNTGGGIARMLVNSPTLAPPVLQGLAAASDDLQQGQSGLQTYLNVFQGVLDSVDPVSFTAQLADSNSDTGILLTEIVGDGTAENPADQTIPNAADPRWGDNMGPLEMVLDNGFVIDSLPAPLSGTEPLVAQFGAVPTASVEESDGDAAVLVTRFTDGSHSTPVTAGNTEADPFTSGAVFMEMVRQIATFFALGGDVDGSIVTDTSVVEEP